MRESDGKVRQRTRPTAMEQMQYQGFGEEDAKNGLQTTDFFVTPLPLLGSVNEMLRADGKETRGVRNGSKKSIEGKEANRKHHGDAKTGVCILAHEKCVLIVFTAIRTDTPPWSTVKFIFYTKSFERP